MEEMALKYKTLGLTNIDVLICVYLSLAGKETGYQYEAETGALAAGDVTTIC